METASSAFVTGADRGLGLVTCRELLNRGWKVFAGQFMPEWKQLPELQSEYPDTLFIIPLDVRSGESVNNAAIETGKQTKTLDMLVNNAGILDPRSDQDITYPQDYDMMLSMFTINSIGPVRMVESFLPLLEKGSMKRLCFVSSEAGSISASSRDAWYGYCMSKAALNMAVKNLHNLLYPRGFSFRLYHPGWMRTYMYGTKDSTAELEPEQAAVPAVNYYLKELDNEDTLTLTDYQDKQWPW